MQFCRPFNCTLRSFPRPFSATDTRPFFGQRVAVCGYAWPCWRAAYIRFEGEQAARRCGALFLMCFICCTIPMRHAANFAISDRQARAAWQWWSYCRSQIPPAKTALRVNMDETAICLFQGGGRGNIFVSKADPRAFQNVPRGRTREFMTHIAFICDDPRVQAHLPQILVANEHTLRVRDMAALQAGLPANVRLLRRKSAWNDAGLCAQTIRWLRDALMPFTDSRQVLLLFDAHRVHTAPRVFAACTACNVWPVLVPAKATWLMQPLDTHAFLAYKIRLQGACQEARLATPSGEMNLLEVIPCVCRAVREVLEGRSWAHAFDRDGFSAGQTGVSDRVLTGLQQSAPLDIPHTKPSLDQVKLCFPKRAKVPWSAIWRPLVKAAAKAAEAAPAPGGEPALPAAPRRSLRIAAHGAVLHVPLPLLPPRGPPPPRGARSSPGASSSSASSSSAPLGAASSSTACPLAVKAASAALGATSKAVAPTAMPMAAAPKGPMTRSCTRKPADV